MELNEYQERAMQTCMPSSANFSYMILNLMGEVGEFSSKVAKKIRKDDMMIKDNFLVIKHPTRDPDAMKQMYDEEADLIAEIGDILWQVAGLAHTCGWTLNDIAEQNLWKLAQRSKAGTIDGNGDGIDGEGRTR